ncbi:CapA family protein, partial [Flavobacteriaceae bacterium]|nr:CapA family protein [Flavobacteriaceae bacterium]
MIKIILAGDFCPTNRVEKHLNNNQYSEVFGDVRPIIESADYAVVNFECPVVLNNAEVIEKTGPALKSGVNAVKSIQFAGFDMVTLANNHFYDYGEKGVLDTLKTCKKFKLDTVGGGRNIDEAAQVYYKEIHGNTIAFINFCENEFSIATENSGGSNPLDPVKNYHQILEARNNADFVIVIVHGGHEYYQLPSLRMKETYRFFVDVGADAVINHHQHCFSGYEIHNEKPIFYGLGNFCFDNSRYWNNLWNEGFMVELKLQKEKISFDLHPYLQCNDTPSIQLLVDDLREKFDLKLLSLNSVINDEYELDKQHKKFLSKKSTFTKLIFEPYRGRLLNALYSKGLLPSFFKKN